MRIRLDLPKIYEKLGTQKLEPEKEFYLEAVKQMRAGETWKSEERPSSPVEDMGEVNLETIFLPTPFLRADGKFERRAKIYTAQVSLLIPEYISRSEESTEIIRKVHLGLTEAFEPNWMQMNSNSGYFLVNGKPRIAVWQNGWLLTVGMGDHGTKEARFGNYEGFSKDGLIFEGVIQRCVNSGVEAAVSIGNLLANPDIEITLEPKKLL